MRSRWSLVPLVTGPVMLLVLLAVLPSALNVPLTNPSETLELAPVPPQDEEPPPQVGNLTSLGLGTSAGPGADARGGSGGRQDALAGLPPPPLPDGTGGRPSTKRCVGNPPRQTEDPMSPPCVAHFQGDNGGATADGVSRDEVVVLVYLEALPISAGIFCHDEGCDNDEYYDLGKPESESPHDEREAYWPHVWRVWQRSFNERYQTYGRFVHLWVHYGSIDDSPEARRADVADAADKLDPFAVVADVAINGEAYAEEWARRDKPVFVTKTQEVDEVGHDARSFHKYPGRLWSYDASVQQLANSYGSFLCAQVVGHPVSFAGDGTNGQPRKLGLLRASDPNEAGQNWIDYGRLIKERLEGCGADIVSEQTFDCDRGCGGGSADADAKAALMRRDGVTTIIYLTKGPSAPGFSHAVARQAPWRPEWIVQMDNTVAIKAYEDPSVFQHARNFTVWPRAFQGAERPCERAYREVEPEESEWYEAWTVCYSFNSGRMLFTGIQVAGPRLTWESLDEGMHAIPAIPSGDPKVPACFYETGDYTCVKDAQAQWWDPAGKEEYSSSAGCWRSMDDAKRYLANAWPRRDVDAARQPGSDACNLQGAYF